MVTDTPKRASGAPTASRHVLVVDDDGISRKAIAALLVADGFSVSTAADGAAALVEAARAQPDVVLTDLYMPGLSGVDLCARLHAYDRALPVILMTASAEMESVIAAMRAGAEDYLMKPIHYEALRLSLERAIAGSETRRELERTRCALNEQLVLSAIRDREIAEAEAKQRIQLGTLLANLSEGVLIADADGRIVMVNDVARRILGLEGKPTLVTALDALDVLDVEGNRIENQQRPLVRALTGEAFSSYETVFVVSNGERRRVVSSGTSVSSEHGDVELAIVVLRDVTALRRLEQQRDEYLSLISHDLRTPLNSVLLSVSMLKEPELPGTLSHQVLAERAERNCDRLSKMLEELSDASRLEASSGARTQARCDMSSIIAGAIDTIDESRARRVTTETDASEPFLVFADVAQLERVVGNLISNALKYSAEGAPVSVRLSHVAGEVVLEVSDRGIGIAPESAKRLFDRYFRTPEGKVKASGLGLGLYIARLMVEANGGRIGVESALGRGTVFTVGIPACLALPLQ